MRSRITLIAAVKADQCEERTVGRAVRVPLYSFPSHGVSLGKCSQLTVKQRANRFTYVKRRTGRIACLLQNYSCLI